MSITKYEIKTQKDAGRVLVQVEHAPSDAADEIARRLCAVLDECVGRPTATGREVIAFLDSIRVPFALQKANFFQDPSGTWLLELDHAYNLDELGWIKLDGDGAEVEFVEMYAAWRRKESEEDPRRRSPRYPYTYAADLVRMSGPATATSELKLSRSDAVSLLQALAPALDLPYWKLASRLADYYLEHEDEIVDMSAARLGVGT